MKSLSFTFQVSAHNFLASHGLQQTYLGLRFINQSKQNCLTCLGRLQSKQFTTQKMSGLCVRSVLITFVPHNVACCFKSLVIMRYIVYW